MNEKTTRNKVLLNQLKMIKHGQRTESIIELHITYKEF